MTLAKLAILGLALGLLALIVAAARLGARRRDDDSKGQYR